MKKSKLIAWCLIGTTLFSQLTSPVFGQTWEELRPGGRATVLGGEQYLSFGQGKEERSATASNAKRATASNAVFVYPDFGTTAFWSWYERCMETLYDEDGAESVDGEEAFRARILSWYESVYRGEKEFPAFDDSFDMDSEFWQWFYTEAVRLDENGELLGYKNNVIFDWIQNAAFEDVYQFLNVYYGISQIMTLGHTRYEYGGEPDDSRYFSYDDAMTVNAYADKANNRIVIKLRNCRMKWEGGKLGGNEGYGLYYNGIQLYLNGSSSYYLSKNGNEGDAWGFYASDRRKANSSNERDNLDLVSIVTRGNDVQAGAKFYPGTYYATTDLATLNGLYINYEEHKGGAEGEPYVEVGYNDEDPAQLVYDYNKGDMNLYIYNPPEDLTDIGLIPMGHRTYSTTSSEEDDASETYYYGRVLLSEKGFDVKSLTEEVNQKKVTLTFDPNGGTGGGSVSAEPGKAISLPADPVRPGYTFDGWYTAREGGSRVTAQTIAPSGAATYYARWKENSYRITYELNGGSAPSGLPSQYYPSQGVAGFAAPTREGYTFAGWSPSSIPKGSTGDQTVTANWNAQEHTICFDAGEGTGGGTSTKRYGETLGTLPEAGRTGYTFGGWFTSPSGGTKVESQTVVRGDATYYAHWNLNSYQAVFHSEGTNDGTVITKNYGAALGALPDSKRTGYTFSGWYTEKNGGTKISPDTLMGAANADYYARWEANRWTVRYDAGGGSGRMESSTFSYDGENRLAANGFTKTGYHFAGWAKEPGGEAAFENGASVGNMTVNPGETITLYALWEANPYTVTLHRNMNQEDTTSVVRKYVFDTAGKLPEKVFERTGYSFDGWTANRDGSGKAYKEGSEVLNWNSELNGNVNLYAKWKANSYRLYYGANGGRVSAAYKDVVYDSAIGELPVPERTNYKFLGWTLNGDAVSADTVYRTAANSYVYAQWELNFELDTETNTNIRPGKDGEFGTDDDERYTNGPDRIPNTEDDREVFPGKDGIYGTEDDYYILNPPHGDRIYAGADREFNTSDDYIDKGKNTILHPGEDTYFGDEPGASPEAENDNSLWWKGGDGQTGTEESVKDDLLIHSGKDGIYGTGDDFVVHGEGTDGNNRRPGADLTFGTKDDVISQNGADGKPGTEDDMIAYDGLHLNRRAGTDSVFEGSADSLKRAGDDLWYWDGADEKPGTKDDVPAFAGEDETFGTYDDYYFNASGPYEGKRVYAGADGILGTPDDFMEAGEHITLRPGENGVLGDTDDELWYDGADKKPGTEDDRRILNPEYTENGPRVKEDSFYEDGDGKKVYPGADLTFGTEDDRIDQGDGTNTDLDGGDVRTNGADGIPGTEDDQPVKNDGNGGQYYEDEEGRKVYPGADGNFGTKDDRVDTGKGTNTDLDGGDERTNGADGIPGTEDDQPVKRDESGNPYVENGDGTVTRPGPDGNFGTEDDEIWYPGKDGVPGTEDDQPVKKGDDGDPYLDNGDGTVTKPGEDGKFGTEDDETVTVNPETGKPDDTSKPVEKDDQDKPYIENEDGSITRPGEDGKFGTDDDEQMVVPGDKKPGEDDKPVKKDEAGNEYIENGDGTITRPGKDGTWNTGDDEIWYPGKDGVPGTDDDRPVKKDESGNPYLENQDGTITRPGPDGVFGTSDDEIWNVGPDKKPGTSDDYKPGRKGSGGGRSSSSGRAKVQADLPKGSWVQNATGWWFRYENGSWPQGQWAYLPWQEKAEWYYFNEAGYMVDGWFQDKDGSWYYLHPVSDGTRGHMYTGWHLIAGKYYYFNDSGRLLMNCVTPDGYRVDAQGVWQP